jgi:hypothetical protein
MRLRPSKHESVLLYHQYILYCTTCTICSNVHCVSHAIYVYSTVDFGVGFPKKSKLKATLPSILQFCKLYKVFCSTYTPLSLEYPCMLTM